MALKFHPDWKPFAEVEIDLSKVDPDEAFQKGRESTDLLSNPYPDGSVEARRFVDGWVDGRKWKRERTPGMCTCGMGPISGCWKCD